MVEHSYITYSSTTIIAGESFLVTIQARDNFYNNLETISSLSSYSFTSNTNSIGTVNFTGGIITADIILTTAVLTTLHLVIDNVTISLPTVIVEANAILSSTTSQIISIPLSGSAGSLISFTIISKDTYGNIRYNPTGGYAIEINDVSWTVQNNKDGTYFVTFTPMIAEIYTISVYVNSIYIQGSPAYITIKPSGVRGYYSSLDVSNVTAGKGFFNIASRDIGGNVVINPVHNKLMGNMHYVFSIKGEQSLMQNAGYMNYAAFFINFPQITKAGDYTVVLGLIEELGLTGFYYQGNDFTNMYEVLPYFNNPGDLIQFYTEKDAQVSFN